MRNLTIVHVVANVYLFSVAAYFEAWERAWCNNIIVMSEPYWINCTIGIKKIRNSYFFKEFDRNFMIIL